MKMPAALLLTIVLMPLAALAADQQSAALLHEALQAQGGEASLRSISNVQFEATGYRNELEESERPEGPYITEFDNVSAVYDFQGNRYLEHTDAVVYPVFKFSSGTVVDGNVAMLTADRSVSTGTPQTVRIAREQEALSPERLLLTALDAKDAHREPDVMLQSIRQNVLVFTLDGAPVRIYLNGYTHLPTAVDYSGPEARSGYWAFLGDVSQRTYYSLWWLAKGGVHLPMQWNVESNGLPDRMLVINKLRINEPITNPRLTIVPQVRATFNPKETPTDYDAVRLSHSATPAKEVMPGIYFIAGNWNVTLVRQDDGIIVLEAPISSSYSSEVIALTHRLFPGQRIKAVITTSDSWPHIAGIREYVAQGIPIYALDLNLPILKRVIAMPYSSRPDALQHAPRQPVFHPVTSETMVGSGANRLEIFPIRGETSERQMMVYFPQYHMLYGSDPFQELPDGSFFYPQTVTELMDAVAMNHLDVQQFFMMHMGLTPWADLGKAVTAAEAKDTPTGEL